MQLLLLFYTSNIFAGDNPNQQKILICGVGKNVQGAIKQTVKNVETLGQHFADYAVIIYENNSVDETVRHFQIWADLNPKVHFVSECIDEKKMRLSREEKIARARNIVLSMAKAPKYNDFKYLIMVDLDFRTPWPINEIIETIKSPIEWDCVSANGVVWSTGEYYDRYAFRNEKYPLGAEFLGDEFWVQLLENNNNWFKLRENDWLPVFSAFGGLAIYKKDALFNCTYSGTPTDDLKLYYTKIFASLPRTNFQIQKYLISIPTYNELGEIPIIFTKDSNNTYNVCCEHVTLHASMALQGHDKFFVNPRMIMYYEVSRPGRPPIVKSSHIKSKKSKKSFWSFIKKKSE